MGVEKDGGGVEMCRKFSTKISRRNFRIVRALLTSTIFVYLVTSKSKTREGLIVESE